MAFFALMQGCFHAQVESNPLHAPNPSPAHAPTQSAPSEVAATPTTPPYFDLQRPWVRFCVSGNAPLVGAPIIDDAGRIYFLSSDGYLHAFEADGRYRFSFTVHGAPRGNLSLRRRDQAILLGTSTQVLYAISQTGGRIFERRTLSPVWSGIEPLTDNSVVFLGLDQRVYAMYENGGSRYRVKMPGRISGPLLVSRPGLVWVPLESGVARLEESYSLKRIELPDSVDALLPTSTGVAALASRQLYWISDAGKLLGVEADVLALAHPTSEVAAALSGQGQVFALAGKPGKRQDLAQLPVADLSGPLAARRRGEGVQVVAPLSTGELSLAQAEESHRLSVLDEALSQVVFAGPDLVIAAAASGQVCAVDLSAAGLPGSSNLRRP